ncbi:MAG: hypothetical protein AB7F35_20300 [Acetobacteraceae bacterium]
MTSSPMPIEVLDAAAQELGLPEMEARLERQDAALVHIIDEATAAVSDHATLRAMKAADLLHAAAKERDEIGYLPPETVRDAITHAAQAKRMSHVARLEREKREGGIER